MSQPYSQGGRISGASSGLEGDTVEEQLAAGASVDGLVASGDLYDDYDPTSDDYDFTPLEPVEERAPGPPLSDEEFSALIARIRKPVVPLGYVLKERSEV